MEDKGHGDVTGRPIKRISFKNFQEEGYLQEANRRFFHPHGLALEIHRVVPDDKGRTWKPTHEPVDKIVSILRKRLSGLSDESIEEIAVGIAEGLWPMGDHIMMAIQDHRDDPEGVYFGADDLGAKAKRIDKDWSEREGPRRKALGYMVQPTDEEEK